MTGSAFRLGSILIVLVLTAAVFAFVLSDGGSEPGAEAQSGLSAPAIRSAAVSSAGRLTVRFAHGQIWQHSFDFKIHQLQDSGGLKLFKRVTAQSSPMRTNVDLGSEYRVEGRTCSRGSCGGWSDLFEVEVPAAAPTATATPSPAATVTATATATVTSTATSTATATATATPELSGPRTCRPMSDGASGRTADAPCEYPLMTLSLNGLVCLYGSIVREYKREGRSVPDIPIDIEITVDGSNAEILEFVTRRNIEYRAYDYKGVEYISVYAIPLSLLPEIHDVDGVGLIEKTQSGVLHENSESSIAADAEHPFWSGHPWPSVNNYASTLSQRVLTNAARAHGADQWHDADPPLTGDGVNVGVIDIGFNGFRSLQGGDRDLPPVSEVTSYCAFADSVSEGSQNTCELPLAPTPRNSSTPTATPHSGWHGTAVSEAIMDIAPDARLFIARPVGRDQLNDAVVWMKDQGVDIINSPMRTSVDLGSEYRVEGRTCARGSCGGWSDLFEVEVPAAAPTATPTPTATSTATSTATATATSTPTPEVVADPANACYLLHSIAATATPTAASGSASQDASASASDVDCSYPKIKGYLGDEIRDLCRAKAQMLAEGVRSSNQDGWEPSYILDIKIVDGGSSESVIAFLTGIGSDFYESRSEKVHWISTGKVPRSQIGPLSELLDVELIRRPSPANLPGTSVLPLQPAAEDSANQGTVSQTLTDASLWHGVDVWHRLGLSWCVECGDVYHLLIIRTWVARLKP